MITVVVPDPLILVPSLRAPTLTSYHRYAITPIEDGVVDTQETVDIPDKVTDPVTVLPTPTGCSVKERVGPFSSRSVGRPL